MSRRTARKHVFSMVFQTEFYSDEDINEAIELYNETITEENVSEKEFIERELKGILENREKIDSIINKYSLGWSVERIAKVDIAILRLAVFEILFADDIPNNVAVNEAVELAKEYSSDKSPAFINGILGKVMSYANKESADKEKL